MSDKLKDCPNCESDDLQWVHDDRWGDMIKCYGCKVSTGYKKTHQEAIDAWEGREDID